MRNIFLVSLLFFISFANNSFAINVDGRQNNREGKVFSLFNIVKFENAGCESTEDDTTSGNKRYGTCYSSSECSDKGGRSKGSCAAGFGVCCTFMYNDGTNQDISQNCTYIQNTNYPNSYTGTDGVTYTVKKCNDNICFLRIDFEDFTITGPANSLEYDSDVLAYDDAAKSGGKCGDDSFTVVPPTSASFTVPTICGKNTGEHIYVPMGTESSGSVSLQFGFTTDGNTRKYDLKLSQIECGDLSAPPEGCLQYYTGTSGKLRTFNFLQDSPKETHLAEQSYRICMRQEDGHCCNQYTVCDESETGQGNSFSLFPDKLNPYASGTARAVTDCVEDYITIDGGKSVCSSTPSGGGYTQTKYCGSRLSVIGNVATTALLANIPICTCQTPFIVGIYTDDTADDVDPADATNGDWSRGICLDYKQQPCG